MLGDLQLSGIYLELDSQKVEEKGRCDISFSKVENTRKTRRVGNETDSTDFLFNQGRKVENCKMTINWNGQSLKSFHY